MADRSASEEPTSGDAHSAPAESAWERKRRLAAIFGDPLPETTRDERGPEEHPQRQESAGDRWLKEQVPPHHGQ